MNSKRMQTTEIRDDDKGGRPRRVGREHAERKKTELMIEDSTTSNATGTNENSVVS